MYEDDLQREALEEQARRRLEAQQMGAFAKPRLKDRVADDSVTRESPDLGQSPDIAMAGVRVQPSQPTETPAPPRVSGGQALWGGLMGQPDRDVVGDKPSLKNRMLDIVGRGVRGAVGGALGPTQRQDIEAERLEGMRLGGQREMMAHQERAERMRLAEMIAATQARGESARDVATIAGASREAAADTRGQAARDVAGTRAESALDVQGLKGTQGIAQEAERQQGRMALQAARSAMAQDVAHIRSAATGARLGQVEQRMKDMAITTLPQIDKLMTQTQQVAGMLGPLAGRWNDFWTGKVGAPNPTFANYMDQMKFLESAITLAHSQGRVSNLIFAQFQQMFAAGYQSPENMMEALKVAKEWMSAYAAFGTPGLSQSTPTLRDKAKAQGGGKTITLDQFLQE